MPHSFESHTRSITKAITWKLLAFFITLAVSYFFTRNIAEAAKITGLAAFIGLFTYYFHERAWNSITWGKTLD